jgi:hypothetical protein
VFRNDPRRADDGSVVVLAWICASFFALCGSALIVSGVLTGGISGLVIGVGLGIVVAAGSIPFVRAARRMNRALRNEPVAEAERSLRRHKVRAILGFYAVCALSEVLFPAPRAVRLIAVIATVLVVPLVLISAFDSAKRQ